MKDIPTSPRIALIKRNRKVGRIRFIILFIVLFISIVVCLSYFSSHKRIVINKIIVTGNSIIDSKELEQNVNQIISGKYISLFARANFLIYPKARIYRDLSTSFPRIEILNINREGLNTLHLSIVERAGSFLYCGLLLPENKEEVGENCFFVNNDGLIFDEAPYFSGNIYFKYYTDIKMLDGKVLGSQVFDIDRFHQLARFIDGVTLLGFKPIYLVKTVDNSYSLYLKSINNKLKPKVIFKEENDLVIILDNFKTAMMEKEFADEINSKYNTLSYIDLRFKNKVLYKFE